MTKSRSVAICKSCAGGARRQECQVARKVCGKMLSETHRIISEHAGLNIPPAAELLPLTESTMGLSRFRWLCSFLGLARVSTRLVHAWLDSGEAPAGACAAEDKAGRLAAASPKDQPPSANRSAPLLLFCRRDSPISTASRKVRLARRIHEQSTRMLDLALVLNGRTGLVQGAGRFCDKVADRRRCAGGARAHEHSTQATRSSPNYNSALN